MRVQGPIGSMNSRNLIGPKAFRRWSKVHRINEFKKSYWSKALKLVLRPLDDCPRPKSGKIEAKQLTWHLFWKENQLVQPKKQ